MHKHFVFLKVIIDLEVTDLIFIIAEFEYYLSDRFHLLIVIYASVFTIFLIIFFLDRYHIQHLITLKKTTIHDIIMMIPGLARSELIL